MKERNGEEILTLLTAFCAENGLRLSGFNGEDLAVKDLRSKDTDGAWTFRSVGPEGEL